MRDEEFAIRLAAWTWAANTLGIPMDKARAASLVEVTAGVRPENLKPALEAVIKSEPEGWLPSPGAVIAAANRIADRKRVGALPAGRELGPEANARWHQERNPDEWDSATWAAFTRRLATDAGFAQRAREARRRRMEWVAGQVAAEIGSRPVSAQFREQVRAQYEAQSFGVFPRPHPTADGWMPTRVGVIEDLENVVSEGGAGW